LIEQIRLSESRPLLFVDPQSADDEVDSAIHLAGWQHANEHPVSKRPLPVTQVSLSGKARQPIE
jgi:hypothetical protein